MKKILRSLASNAIVTKKENNGKDLMASYMNTKPAGKPDLHWHKDKRPKETKTDRGTFGFK